MAAKFISHVIAILGAVMIVSLALTSFLLRWFGLGNHRGTWPWRWPMLLPPSSPWPFLLRSRSRWPNSGRAVADHTESAEGRAGAPGLQDDEVEATAKKIELAREKGQAI